MAKKKNQIDNANREVRFHKVMGFYHVHICQWCGVEVACFNGSTCDMALIDGYCDQDCYDHKASRRQARVGQPTENL